MMAELCSSKMDLHALIRGKYCLRVVSPCQKSSNNTSQTTSKPSIPNVQILSSLLLHMASSGGSSSPSMMVLVATCTLLKALRPQRLLWMICWAAWVKTSGQSSRSRVFYFRNELVSIVRQRSVMHNLTQSVLERNGSLYLTIRRAAILSLKQHEQSSFWQLSVSWRSTYVRAHGDPRGATSQERQTYLSETFFFL